MTLTLCDENAGLDHRHALFGSGGACAEMRDDRFLTLKIWRHHGDFHRSLTLGSAATQKNTVGGLKVKLPNTTVAFAKSP
jgi:hypothetical protein